MKTTMALVAVAALLVVACEDAAPPKPVAPPAGQGIKPLTSRDGATTSAPRDSAPTGSAPETLPPGHPPIGGQGAPAAPSGPGVMGTIEMASTLRDRSAPTDALFIIARSAETHQVVAVRKEPSVHFPFAFRISGADAMTEGTAFAGPFDITARLSKSGDAMPGKGDIEGTAKGVVAGAKGVAITLEAVRQ